MSDEITSGYALTRQWFDFAYENPDLVCANDTALYLWLVELNNRLGWAEKFGITRQDCMLSCGFKSFRPYKNALENLIKLGFIRLVKKSANQYQCNVIAIVKKQKQSKSKAKALDKALQKQSKSIGNIQLNTETPKHLNVVADFSPPTLDQAIEYFTQNSFPESLARRAYDYYHDRGWKDKNGNPVQNWKLKFQTSWMKEQDKVLTPATYHPETGLPKRYQS